MEQILNPKKETANSWFVCVCTPPPPHPPERKLVPSVSDPAVPFHCTEVQPPPRSSVPRILSHTLPHSTVPKWVSVSLLLVTEQRRLHVQSQDSLLDLVWLCLLVTISCTFFHFHFYCFRQMTAPRPGHHCPASMTTKRRPLWCLLSPKRPQSSAIRRCVD